MSLNLPQSQWPRVVVIGGGFGGLALVKALRRAKVQLVLIDKNNYHTFQPLLYQVATAGLEPDSIAYPLRKIFQKHENLIFRMAEVVKISPDKNELETSIGTVKYDYLILSTGSRSNYFGNESLADKVVSLKSIPDAFDLRSLIFQRFEQALLTDDVGRREELMTFVVVGGGPTGVETAGALCELKRHILAVDYPELDIRRMQIHLVEASPKLLASMSAESSAKSRKFLEDFGVNVWVNTPVKGFDGSVVQLPEGKSIRAATVIWTAGVLGAPPEGLPKDIIARGNRIRVDEVNRVKGFENFFAIGDVAYMETPEYPHGHPQVAPVSMQMARHLGRNLIKIINHKEPLSFKYYDQGTMATIGRNRAVVDLRHVKFQGFFAWFVWMFVHIRMLVGFRNRMVVFVNWIWNYLTYDRGVRLILRGFRLNQFSDETKQPSEKETGADYQLKS